MRVNASSTFVAPSFAPDSAGAAWVKAQQDADRKGIAAGEIRMLQSTEDLQASYTRGSFVVDAATRAERSLETIQRELETLGARFNRAKPELANREWDVTVTDGRLSITGDLAAEDKAWLQTALDANREVTRAAEDYIDAAVMYLQTTEDNPPFVMINGAGGSRVEHNFPDVASALEGRLRFRENIREVVELHNHGRHDRDKQSSVVGYAAGHYSFELLSAKLPLTAGTPPEPPLRA